MDFIYQGVEEDNKQDEFGYVIGVKIPNLSTDKQYKNIQTCIGFVRFENHFNHDLAAKWLHDVDFYNKPFEVKVNSTPTSSAQRPRTDDVYRKRGDTATKKKRKTVLCPTNKSTVHRDDCPTTKRGDINTSYRATTISYG